MSYTNSPLVVYTKLSPNHSGTRTHSIDRITPHCVVGQLSAESICGCFTSTSRQASCNYGIGKDGRVSLCVEEKNRSWCSSSNANDQRAITIECASDMKEPYAMNDAVYSSLIKLCVDICQRNGKKKLLWLGNKEKSLAYNPASDEMILTAHRFFANKSCPGDWLYSRLGDLAGKVTAQLGGESASNADNTTDTTTDTTTKVLYRVRKTWKDSASQKGAFTVLSNAKDCADSNPGYSVFDESGKKVYTGKNTETADEDFTPYRVRVSIDNLNIRRGPGVGFARRGYTGRGIFTIVDEAEGWGLLKSYESNHDGWISLAYCEKL